MRASTTPADVSSPSWTPTTGPKRSFWPNFSAIPPRVPERSSCKAYCSTSRRPSRRGRTRRFSATTTGRSPSATILRQPWDSGFCRTDAASANSTTRRRSAASESASSNTSAPAKTTFSSSPASAGCSRSSGAAASTCTTCAADGTRSAHAPCRPANSSRPPNGSTASSRSWPNASASRTRHTSSPCGKTWSATRCYGPQTTSVSATAGASSEPLPPARSCSAQRPTRPAGIRC